MSQVTPVTLTVPAHADYARSVRMLAANLAVVQGLCVDSVEDVRMAAEEGFIYACATGVQSCQISFEPAESAMRMAFKLGDADPESEDLSFALMLLTAICDEVKADDDAHELRVLVSCGGAYAQQ